MVAPNRKGLQMRPHCTRQTSMWPNYLLYPIYLYQFKPQLHPDQRFEYPTEGKAFLSATITTGYKQNLISNLHRSDSITGPLNKQSFRLFNSILALEEASYTILSLVVLLPGVTIGW